MTRFLAGVLVGVVAGIGGLVVAGLLLGEDESYRRRFEQEG